MKLRKIEILGFKSFRSKTGIEIGDGVTAVVGPNGCGKSNIVDAIRWAMGSQSPRDLRGRSMEDIIFGGSENHRPMGFAEVSLSFSNDPESSLLPLEWRDQEMVKVTRRLFRNGDSDYEINGSRARLRDVQDVFAGTGVSSRDAYSIIEQGRIGFVVSARPEERRVIIEEAAGITRYKNQRKIAARRLEKTQDNLLRVGDVVREVGRQVTSLNRQAQRAIAAREMKDELRGLEMTMHAETLRKNEAAYHRAVRDFRALDERSRTGQVELAAQETRFNALRLELQVLEAASSKAAEAAYEARTRVELLEANLEHRQREKALNAERRVEAATRIERDQEQFKELEEELRRATEATDQDQDAGEALDFAVEEAEEASAFARSHAREASERMQTARSELADCERILARSSTRADALRSELRAMRARNEESSQVLVELAERAQNLRQQVQEAEEILEGAMHALEDAREAHEDLLRRERVQREAAEEALEQERKVIDERRRVEAALESVNHLLATGIGIADGARWVLQQTKQQGWTGVHGPFGARLRIAEGSEAVFGALFGEWADAIVVDTKETAIRVLMLARDAGKSIAVVTLEQAKEGAINPWLEALAPVPAVFFDIAANTKVVDALDQSEGGAVDAQRLWTDGQGRFAFRAGAMAAEQLVKAQRERELLKIAREEWEEKELQIGDQRFEAQRALEALQANRHEAMEALQLLEESTRRHRLQLEDLRGQAQNAERQWQRVKLEHEASEERQKELLDDLQRTQQAAEKAQEDHDALSDAVIEAQKSLKDAEQRREEVEERLTTLKIQKARRDAERQNAEERLSRIRRELAMTEERIADGQKTVDLCLETEQALRRASDGESQELQRWRESKVERDIEAAKAKTRWEELAQRVRELEMHLADIRRHGADQDRNREQAMLGVERARNELERANEYATDKFGLSPDSLRSETAGTVVTEALEARVTQLQTALEALGAVNPAAEQEYAEALERHRFLEEQQLDLQAAMDDLETAIEKMDATCRTLFLETFEQVNEGFQKMFPRLFRGGQARLELTDPSDLLATGVDIVAQPPGKRLQNLSLLSGGEKALTAAALIFAIFELRPSPICILDEVDAPLDEANVGRFAEMVREISNRSQFLVITHNTRTMEVADTLYGVTMQEPGVSKLVGVHLREGSRDYHFSSSLDG